MSKQLSPDLFKSLSQAALSNGRELIGDAEVLLAADRVPRVMALSILAEEELSKALLLWMCSLAERQGTPIDPNILRKGLKQHKVKLVIPDILRLGFKNSIDTPIETQIKAMLDYVPEALHHADTSDRIKQHAFYVHYTDDKVVPPSDSITESHARTRLDFAKSWLALLEMIQPYLVEDRFPAPTIKGSVSE